MVHLNTRQAHLLADGITLFTVGLGDRIDGASLRAMASSPTHYVHAPDGEDLPAAYARVREAIPCPGAAFWPRDGTLTPYDW